MSKSTNDNVVPLHQAPPPKPTVEDVFEECVDKEFKDVIVIGRYEDGGLCFNSTILGRADINYVLDLVKLDMMTS